jgi:hypothetical protein
MLERMQRIVVHKGGNGALCGQQVRSMFDNATQTIDAVLFFVMRDVSMVVQQRTAQQSLSCRRGPTLGNATGIDLAKDFATMTKRGHRIANQALLSHTERSQGRI